MSVTGKAWSIRVRRAILYSLSIALLLYIAYLVRNGLLVIYLSAVFAAALKPAVDRVAAMKFGRWSPSPGMSIALIALALALAVGLLLTSALPPMVNDIRSISADLPERLDQLRRKIPFLSYIKPEGGRLPQMLGGLALNTAGAIAAAVTILILTAYFILDGEQSLHWLLSLTPAASRNRLESTLLRATARMRGWIVGQGLLMLILGSASAVTFGALRIKYFYLLAVFAGVANIIPLVGPVATVLLASLVAAMDSSWKVLGVLIFYLIYQQVENAYLTPKIMKAEVQLSGAGVIVALVLGGELAGVPGTIVAVPTAVLIATFIDEYLSR